MEALLYKHDHKRYCTLPSLIVPDALLDLRHDALFCPIRKGTRTSQIKNARPAFSYEEKN